MDRLPVERESNSFTSTRYLEEYLGSLFNLFLLLFIFEDFNFLISLFFLLLFIQRSLDVGLHCLVKSSNEGIGVESEGLLPSTHGERSLIY